MQTLHFERGEKKRILYLPTIQLCKTFSVLHYHGMAEKSIIPEAMSRCHSQGKCLHPIQCKNQLLPKYTRCCVTTWSWSFVESVNLAEVNWEELVLWLASCDAADNKKQQPPHLLPKLTTKVTIETVWPTLLIYERNYQRRTCVIARNPYKYNKRHLIKLIHNYNIRQLILYVSK